MVFIMLEKDKNYVSPLLEMRPILPAHHFYFTRHSRCGDLFIEKAFESVQKALRDLKPKMFQS